MNRTEARPGERHPAATDYWQVLGLAPDADALALKRAFRAQARRWHPDLNANDPVAEERFKLINEAYAVLSDPRRRQAWERGEEAAGAGAKAADDPFAAGFPDFDDYLASLFGRQRRPPGEAQDPRWWDDSPERPADDGEQDTPEEDHADIGGAVAAQATATPVRAASDEESEVWLSPEQALNGARIQLDLADGTSVELQTPPMAGDGWRLRLAGVTPGGGDHFLQLRVRTEEGLRIDGLRVLYRLELSPAEAALGCSMVVPTLSGPVQVRVPAGSSSGRLLRLRGRGLRWNEHRGDQFIELRIVVPESPEEAERALYRRLLELQRDPDVEDR